MSNNVHGKCLRMEILLLLFAWFWVFFFPFYTRFSSVSMLFCFVGLLYSIYQQQSTINPGRSSIPFRFD